MTTLPQTIFAAAAGGALGAALRAGFLAVGIGGAAGIFALNVAGSLALGLVLTLLGERAPLLTVFLGTGLLGALTTFSTFAADAVRLTAEAPLMAALYVGASVVMAIAAFILGSGIGRALL